MIPTSLGSSLGYWMESEFPPTPSVMHRGLITPYPLLLMVTVSVPVALSYARLSCLQLMRLQRRELCSIRRSRTLLERSAPRIFGHHFRSLKE